MAIAARGWFLTNPGSPLEERELPLQSPGADEVIVKVLGNGLCHTDLGFADGSVRPVHPLPLVLGHECVGVVVEAGEGFRRLVGSTVIVPAVLPCGACSLCKSGRGNACARQEMPGNHIHGALATHVLVRGAPLVEVRDVPAGFDVRLLAVVADAVSTAFQATRRAELREGDAAVVVGAGGVGGFVVQIAAALGAHVVALDAKPERLAMLRDYGAGYTLSTTGADARELRREVQRFTDERALPSERVRVFECSGHPKGQELAFTLLPRAGTMVQVGFTPQKVELRLSNVMALDATIHGTWGAPPEAYGAVLDLILSGSVALAPFVDFAPLSTVNETLERLARGLLPKRVVLTPDA